MAALSIAQQIAMLSPEEQAEALEGMDPDQLLWEWDFWARDDQKEPAGDWSIWVLMAGRGAGKTRSAAEWIRDKAKQNPGCRIGLTGRTASDVRDVMIQGVSGLLAVCPPSERPEWKPSTRSVVWPNGSTATAFSAEVPDQLRGPAFHYSWGDEAAAWPQIPDASGLTAWNNLEIATREGTNPRVIVTTTPKRVPMMYKLIKEANDGKRVVLTRARTADNAAYLSQSYLDAIYGVYGGTALAAQELEGILSEDVEGALWTFDTIDAARLLTEHRPTLPLRVVAVDPSVAENPHDECGIVVVGSTNERELYRRHAYVLEDASLLGSPDVWARKVIATAKKFQCPVVAEGTQGQALVVNMLKSIDPAVKVYLVQATRSKKLRAEPIVLPYQQGRVHHWGYLPDLESQQTSWDPENDKKSPDRVDALVHGLTALLIAPPKGFGSGPLRAHSQASRQVQSSRGSGLGSKSTLGTGLSRGVAGMRSGR